MKELKGARERIKQLPKPRKFLHSRFPYRSLKEMERDLARLRAKRLAALRAHYDRMQKARLAALEKKPKVKKYVAKGEDPVDKLLADFINSSGC